MNVLGARTLKREICSNGTLFINKVYKVIYLIYIIPSVLLSYNLLRDQEISSSFWFHQISFESDRVAIFNLDSIIQQTALLRTCDILLCQKMS